MAKYNYNKKVLKGLSVGPFLKEVKVREEHIAAASDELPVFDYNANNLGAKLHPSVQFGKIKEVIEHKDAKTFVIVPNEEKGCKEFAYFRAGQYISVALEIGKAKLNKPYSLCSDPKSSLGEKKNSYEITVKKTETGYASKYILENWKKGTELTLSAPLGDFYYVGLRDAKNVVAIAGGSGITPFLAMARSIASGLEKFSLTILYGSRNEESILLKKELDEAVAASKGKVKVVNVLSDEKKNGFENGFITAELIKKYAGNDDYSIFICGPKAMYNFVRGEIDKLKLPLRRVRFELSGEFGNPSNDPKYDKSYLGKQFKLSILVRGEKFEATCKAEETIMSAIESAGIRIPSDCRSGKCGWCHSRLISGNVFVPESADGRRLATKKFNWIHPCASYPLSDIEIEVFPLLEGK